MFTLTIETDGAAFDPEFAAPAYEVGRILHALADALTLHGYPREDTGTVRDSNGNTVGRWIFADDLADDLAGTIRRVSVGCGHADYVNHMYAAAVVGHLSAE